VSRVDWSIVVHGGAREIPDEQREAFRSGTLRAVAAGTAVLAAGGSAVDAVEAAVRVLETDPTFNAGTGAVLTADGEPQLDAAIMDGASLDVGAIASGRGLRHPVTVARAALRGPQVLVTGPAIDDLARDAGDEGTPATADTALEGDTVGCIALDGDGHLAAATSTGGLDGSPRGRIGDSPLPGGGFYAEDGVGAVALSGDGERIARTALASWTLHRADGSARQDALDAALARLAGIGGEGGIILLDPEGRAVWAHNSPDFAVAWADSATEPHAATRREDLDA
jgi:beta-aspartyl-peptidase (threonine type)